jgi:hypothetical protein
MRLLPFGPVQYSWEMMSGRGFTGRLDRSMLPCTFGNAFHTQSTPRNEVLAKREKITTPSGSFDDKVYIDNIGVPRGMPDEFKARDRNPSRIRVKHFQVVYSQ